MTDLAGCRIYEVDRPAKRADMVTLVWDRCDMYVTDSNAMSVDSGKRFRNVTTANMLTPSSYKLFVSSIHKTILYYVHHVMKQKQTQQKNPCLGSLLLLIFSNSLSNLLQPIQQPVAPAMETSRSDFNDQNPWA